MERGSIKTNESGRFSNLIKVVLILAFIVFLVFGFLYTTKKPKTIKAVVSTILNEQKTISELSILRVPHGDMIIKNDDSGKEIERIVYTGSIEYAIEFSDIKVTEDINNKIVIITLPNIEVINTIVPLTNIHIIPTKDTGKGNGLFDRQKECENHIIKQFETNQEMRQLAEESVTNTMKNFLEPIIKGIDSSYTLKVNVGE